jgi:hypothetical protein
MHSRSRRRLPGAAVLLGLAACAGRPEIIIRVQGTVETVGSRRPIPDASVTVEWPAALGGGQSELQSDAQGHFAVGRTRRVPKTACAGMSITVQAPDFASAYVRHTRDCGTGTLTFEIPMLPQVR